MTLVILIHYFFRERDRFCAWRKMASMGMLFSYLSFYQMVFLAGGKLDKDPKKHADLLKYFASTFCSMFSVESLRQLKHMEIVLQVYQSTNYSLPNLLTSLYITKYKVLVAQLYTFFSILYSFRMKQALREDLYWVFLPEKHSVIGFYWGHHLLEAFVGGWYLNSLDILSMQD